MNESIFRMGCCPASSALVVDGELTDLVATFHKEVCTSRVMLLKPVNQNFVFSGVKGDSVVDSIILMRG